VSYKMGRSTSRQEVEVILSSNKHALRVVPRSCSGRKVELVGSNGFSKILRFDYWKVCLECAALTHWDAFFPCHRQASGVRRPCILTYIALSISVVDNRQ